MNEKEREIYQDRIFAGELAKKVLSSSLATHLCNQAHSEIEEALDAFIDLDPHDYKAVTNLQVRIRTALAAMQWMNQAIEDGATAMDEYMQLREIDKEQKEEGQ